MTIVISSASEARATHFVASHVAERQPEKTSLTPGVARIPVFVVLYKKTGSAVLLVGALQDALTAESQESYGEFLKPLLPAHEEADLISLWARRGELDKPEWDRLWIRVTKVLGQCRPSILKQLSGEHEEHAVDFFLNKVIQDKYTETRLNSAAALATFFQRYLLDLVRYQARRPTTYLDDESALDHLSESGDDSAAFDMATAKSGPAESSHWKQLLEAAATFVDALGHEDQIYLSLHACDEESEALYKIAAKYNIASYHYKAGQLGITRKKGELPEDFERTRIGTWLTQTLGLRIVAECAGDILEAFEALCEAAAAARERLLMRLSHA